MRRIILASTSPYRRHQLKQIGLSFEQLAPLCDEESLKDPSLSPPQLASFLAQAKARSIAAGQPSAIVIGSDQLAHCDGQILGKPGTVAAAEQQLALLQGRQHQLITALCICANGSEHVHIDTTTLTMHPHDEAAIARYVAADQPLDCAGAYKLESRGITLFEHIESADHSAITGLPLLALVSQLRQLGVTLP